MRTIICIFKFYLRMLQYRFYVLILFALLATFLDGISFGFLLPIIKGVQDENVVNLIVRNVLNLFGAPYSLVTMLIAFCTIVTIRSICVLIYDIVVFRLRTYYESTIPARFLKGIFGMQYLSTLKYPSGTITSIVTHEIYMAISSITIVNQCIISVFFTVFYLIVPMWLNIKMVLVFICIGTPIIITNRILSKKIQYYSKKLVIERMAFFKKLIQTVQNIKYFKVTGTTKLILAHIDKLLKTVRFYDRKQSLLISSGKHIYSPFIAIFIAGLIYYYCSILGSNIIDIVFVIGLLVRGFQSLNSSQVNFRKLSEIWGSIQIIEQFEEDIQRNSEKKDGVDIEALHFENPIYINNVSFRYAQDREYVLRHITLTIQPRTTVAFVGMSGCGKSTLVNLIASLLQPSEGDIKIGDVSYRDMKIESFRDKISYVSQDKMVFNDSIRNNILLWRNNVDEKKFEHSLEKAEIEEYFKSLPLQTNTLLGENGIDLSGGQRQRLCIAREFYNDGKLLILDEATSDLDTETEIRIHTYLRSLKGTCTIILIAHRLSTIREADCIYVIEQGAIVEKGTYAELCVTGTVFNSMVALQKFD